MEVNGDQQLFGYQHSSKYLLLLFNIWNVPNIWFGMTWRRVNYDKIKMLGWTIPFKGKQTCHQQHTGPFKQWIKRHLEKDLSVLSAPQIVSTWYWYHSLPSYGLRVSTEWWSGSVYYPWVCTVWQQTWESCLLLALWLSLQSDLWQWSMAVNTEQHANTQPALGNGEFRGHLWSKSTRKHHGASCPYVLHNLLRAGWYILNNNNMWPWTTKPVLVAGVYFVATAKNTFYGSKLMNFLLCQKSLGY